MVRLLLDLGADPTRRDALGFSALGCVSEKTDPEILALLEQSGLRLSLYDALVLARYEQAEALLDPASIRRGGNQTHLFVYAVAKGNWPMAEWLLARGADINAIAEVYQCPATALHFAVENKPPERIRWLLDQGADPGIRDGKFDSDVRGWATFLGRDEIVRIIDEHLSSIERR
jgi:ankyrin repeat protein